MVRKLNLDFIHQLRPANPISRLARSSNPLLDRIRCMPWRTFFKTYSDEVPYCSMVSDMLVSFAGVLDPGELEVSRYSRWEAPNETRYLDALDNIVARGGVYVGVATEPVNFTYICRVKPELAVFVDINPAVSRVQLPLKGALLELATNRLEFLSYVLGRPLEGRVVPELRTAHDFADFFSQIPYSREFRESVWQRIAAELDPSVRSEAYEKFMDNFGIQPENGFPAEMVLLAKYIYWNMGVRDQRGQQNAWLTNDQDFYYIRDMWQDGRIKGVAGDISGHVVNALGELTRDLGLQLSCLYLSNVEDPVEISGRTRQFRLRINKLPWHNYGQVIRYDFGGENHNAFNIQRVGIAGYTETGFDGIAEAVLAHDFLYS